MVGIVPATVSWNISGGRGAVDLADLLTLRRVEGQGRPRSSKHDRDHEAELYLYTPMVFGSYANLTERRVRLRER